MILVRVFHEGDVRHRPALYVALRRSAERLGELAIAVDQEQRVPPLGSSVAALLRVVNQEQAALNLSVEAHNSDGLNMLTKILEHTQHAAHVIRTRVIKVCRPG